MRNLLYLHEAIAVVLLDKSSRTATFKEIENEIAKRGLYSRPKDGLPPPEYQIKDENYYGKRPVFSFV